MSNFLQHGLINLPWWGYIILTLAITHVTILAVTIFLHRHQAHRALDLHPAISHFFRFWLWLTTGMVTKEWTAIHRKHHAFSDKVGDPHSPQVFGLKKVLREGAELYQKEAKNSETLSKYGNGTPDDWLERNVYTKHSKLGISLMLIIDLVLFGPIGLSIWAIQMVCIPISAAGIINGIGHFWGYRNFPTTDSSRNIFPLGILIGGEELHNNHHTFGTSAKFSFKWYEFDLGWMWIKILERLKLAKVKKTLPVLNKAKTPKLVPDYQTLEAIISNRYNLMMRYAKTLKRDCKNEIAKLQLTLQEKISWRRLKYLLAKDQEMLTQEEQSIIQMVMDHSQLLKKVFALRADLTTLWQRSNLTKEELLNVLQLWCKKAEASGIQKLQAFSLSLKASY
jgi:stearoyl-CoA desaturase (delta-9 desaturase)